MPQKTYRFYLDIPYHQFLSVYQGIHSAVRTKTSTGQIIEFPARKLQVFLTKQGIQGYFELTVTEQNKFVAIKKL
jgi:hypothetical protein